MVGLEMNNDLIFIIITGLGLSVAIILWVEGIDYMKKNNSDYKSDDFLEEDE